MNKAVHPHKKTFKKEPTYSIPTREKNGELALFYNMAYERTSQLLSFYETKTIEIRNLFPTENKGDSIAIEQEVFTQDLLKDSTYATLKLFLWKEKKGRKIILVKPFEKEMLNHFLYLLWRLRDFHSHFWHNASGTIVHERLRPFLVEKFNEAMSVYEERYPFAVRYHDNRKLPIVMEENNQISKIGIDFFLSFFLSKGQMELFMNNREFLKNKGIKSNRQTGQLVDYDFMRKVSSHYCLPDAHQLNFSAFKKNDVFTMGVGEQIEEGKPLQQQSELILKAETENYLNTLPKELFAFIAENNNELVQRRHQNYLGLLVQYIALYMKKALDQQKKKETNWQHRDLLWKTTEVVFEERQVEREETQEEKDNRQIPQQYEKVTHLFNQDFGIQFKNDPNNSIDEKAEKRMIQFNTVPLIRANKACIELHLNTEQKVRFDVGINNLKHWATYIVGGHTERILETLFDFASEYIQFADFLKTGAGNFELESTEHLKLFSQKGTPGKKDQPGLRLPPKFLEIYRYRKEKEAVEVNTALLRKLIRNKLDYRENYLNELIDSGGVGKYRDYQMTEQLVIEFNTLKTKKRNNKNRFGDREDEKRFEELKEFQKEDSRMNRRKEKERHVQMQSFLNAMKWILGRSIKFNSTEQKKAFCKYVYLLDEKESADAFLKSEIKEAAETPVPLYSASEWIARLKTKYQLEEGAENNQQLNSRKELYNILVHKAKSFNEAYKQLLQLALKDIEQTRTEITKHEEREQDAQRNNRTISKDKKLGQRMWLLYKCSRLGIANPSVTESANSDLREATRKEVNRIDELLKPFTYRYAFDNATQQAKEGYIFNLPNWFFKTIDPNNQYMKATKESKVLNLVSTKRTLWRQLTPEEEETRDYFLTGDDFGNKISKSQYKKATTLYNYLVEDALLELLCMGYFSIQLRKKLTPEKRKYRETTLSHRKKIENVQYIVHIPPNQLQQNNSWLRANHIDAMLMKQHAKLKKKGEKLKPEIHLDYQQIIQLLQSYYVSSIGFLSSILKGEQEHGKALGWEETDLVEINATDPIPEEFEYRKFESFKDYFLENYKYNDFDRLVKDRNKAMHADVKPTGKNYALIRKDT